MAVEDRIKKVKQYFKGMQVENVDGSNIIYVVVQFPSKWIIDDDIPNKFGVSVGAGNEYAGQFYFCAEIEKGFDIVFDAIEYNIEKMLTAQERATLLRQKIQDLQNMFMDESISIESLRTLEFTYKQPKQQKSKKKNSPKKDEENEIIEENTNIENE